MRPATSPARCSSSTEEWSPPSQYDFLVSPRRLALVAAVAVVVFVADRLTKAWVTENIPVNTARPVIGDYVRIDRKSTRLNSSHVRISYAVFCLKNKKQH